LSYFFKKTIKISKN